MNVKSLSRDKYLKYILLIPACSLLLLFILLPIFYSVRLSFFQWFLGAPQRTFIGIQNYIEAFSDPLFWTSFKNSLIFTFVTVFFEMTLGLAIALLFSRDFIGSRIARAIILLPMMVAPVVVGFMFLIIFHGGYGIFNYIFSSVGIIQEHISWLGNPKFALPSLILAEVWQRTPFVILVSLAGIKALPEEPYEAAVVDGASRFQIFRYITLPLLKNILFIALTIRTIISLRVFAKVYTLTGGGPGSATYVLNLLGYKTGLEQFQMGYSASIVVIIFVVTMAFTVPIMRRAHF